jgi:hypothetical protein
MFMNQKCLSTFSTASHPEKKGLLKSKSDSPEIAPAASGASFSTCETSLESAGGLEAKPYTPNPNP